MEQPRKILLADEAAMGALSIDSDTLDWLVDTRQLAPITIRGRRLFPVAQLNELVTAYSVVQARGNGGLDGRPASLE